MKRNARKKETVCICPYCLEAIRSHGEKVATTDYVNDTENTIVCWWCQDETEEYYKAEI